MRATAATHEFEEAEELLTTPGHRIAIGWLQSSPLRK
jgi:hypothetical protein